MKCEKVVRELKLAAKCSRDIKALRQTDRQTEKMQANISTNGKGQHRNKFYLYMCLDTYKWIYIQILSKGCCFKYEYIHIYIYVRVCVCVIWYLCGKVCGQLNKTWFISLLPVARTRRQPKKLANLVETLNIGEFARGTQCVTISQRVFSKGTRVVKIFICI